MTHGINTNTNATFQALFDAAKPIEYKANWANGTGYYDGAADEILEHGEIRCTMSPFPNNRPIILIGGGDKGCMVFFRRFSLKDTNGTVVCNISGEISSSLRNSNIGNIELTFDGAQSDEAICAKLYIHDPLMAEELLGDKLIVPAMK